MFGELLLYCLTELSLRSAVKDAIEYKRNKRQKKTVLHGKNSLPKNTAFIFAQTIKCTETFVLFSDDTCCESPLASFYRFYSCFPRHYRYQRKPLLCEVLFTISAVLPIRFIRCSLL